MGSAETALSGMVTTTTWAPRAASAAVTAVAPVSFASAASVSGPRELATDTSWPSAVRRLVRLPPMFPAPMMPIFMDPTFRRCLRCVTWVLPVHQPGPARGYSG